MKKNNGELDSVLNEQHYFSCPVYFISRPDFSTVVAEVSDEYVERSKMLDEFDELYPVIMTDNYYSDNRLNEFVRFIGTTAWSILDHQGYAMDDYELVFNEMWTQQHYKHSLMEEHMHGYGSVITGFYFLECPDDCSKVVFGDPRPAKIITNLPEKDLKKVTHGSKAINFEPRPGDMIFTNSWLPHSFSRHGNTQPIKFVHFNLTALPLPKNTNHVYPSTNCVEIV